MTNEAYIKELEDHLVALEWSNSMYDKPTDTYYGACPECGALYDYKKQEGAPHASDCLIGGLVAARRKP